MQAKQLFKSVQKSFLRNSSVNSPNLVNVITLTEGLSAGLSFWILKSVAGEVKTLGDGLVCDKFKEDLIRGEMLMILMRFLASGVVSDLDRLWLGLGVMGGVVGSILTGVDWVKDTWLKSSVDSRFVIGDDFVLCRLSPELLLESDKLSFEFDDCMPPPVLSLLDVNCSPSTPFVFNVLRSVVVSRLINCSNLILSSRVLIYKKSSLVSEMTENLAWCFRAILLLIIVFFKHIASVFYEILIVDYLRW